MHWYYSKNGAQSGPVDQEELAAMLANGSLRWDELVWSEGMANWLPASAVPQLRPPAPTGAPPPPLQSPFASNPYLAPTTTPAPLVGQPIPTYLWQSIVVTCLCCLPFGIPAIVYAAKVEGLARSGDIAGAQEASRMAKMWCWIGFLPGLAFLILWIISVMIGVGGAAIQGGAGL